LITLPVFSVIDKIAQNCDSGNNQTSIVEITSTQKGGQREMLEICAFVADSTKTRPNTTDDHTHTHTLNESLINDETIE